VPGSPFAYWVSERIRRLFTELPAFEGDGRAVRVGLQTSDDFRFVRAWWEVLSEAILDGTNGPDWSQDLTAFQAWCRQRTFEDKRWVPFAKGGEYSTYYADIHLVVDWERDGEEIKNLKDPRTGRLLSRPQNMRFYFHAGLTWSDRTTRLFSARVWPAGGVFSVKGSSGFFSGEELFVLGVMNSVLFNGFLSLLVGAGDAAARSYQVGTIGTVPFPVGVSTGDYSTLRDVASESTDIKRTLDSTKENSRSFYLPALLGIHGDSLADLIELYQTYIVKAEEKLDEYQSIIDNIVFHLYGIDSMDRRAIEENLNAVCSESNDEEQNTDSEDEEAEVEPTEDSRQLVADLLSYAVGCVFGRWDVRFATGERQRPKPLDPFAPLPISSTGMLIGEDGLPLREAPPEYPLRSDQDGILVDDPDNPDDIVRRVREVLELLWQDHAEAIEQEACEILGVQELRDYFRKPGKGGFWGDHVSRYSKSRRKAPIYWLLQSSKKNYALWIYYNRLDKDMLFKALLSHVEPKIRLEESRIEPLRAQRAAVGTSGKGVKKLEKEIDRQEEFISELRDFEDKLRRAANLHLEPDLNDGVILNIAPLWELVPWKEAKKYWEELRDDKYEWSSIGKQLRQKGIARSP